MGTARSRRRYRRAVPARGLSERGAAIFSIWWIGRRLGAARASMHRGRVELALDALVMIEPLDRAVEFGALFLGELGFHLGNLIGEPDPIQFVQRSGDVSQHGETLLRHFGKA